MSGAHLSFTFDDAALRHELRDRLKKLDDLEPFLKSIGEEFVGADGIINTRFKTETDPEGNPWTPLSDERIAYREKKFPGAPLTILRMRGHLAGSINYQVDGSKLKIGTDTNVEDYAAIHQFGGEAGRNLAAEIPARPYLGYSQDDLDHIHEELEVYLDGK